MKNIRNSYILCWTLVAGLAIAGIFSCNKIDNYNGPVSTDKTKPGIITNVRVVNFNGGAYIIYTLPNSPNLLYVQAEYKINDTKSRQTKSSYYSDTIVVNGFARSQDYTVTLYSVSRADVKSDPVTVTVHPATPVYKLIRPTIVLTPDFGGINIRAIDTFKKPVGFILIAYDTATNNLEIQDQHFTSTDTINYSVRGYDSVPRKFGVYVTDEFGNVSDTLIQIIKPLYETRLNKGNFFVYHLPNDTPIGYGWELFYMWDGNTSGTSTGWHTNPGNPLPILCTFGMGIKAKLSRFTVWERTAQFTYGHGNPKDFTVWGSNATAPQDAVMPKVSPVGTVVGDWINLGNYHYPDPPSGLPAGATNAQDEAFVQAGVDFNVPISAPPVKFIRLGVAATWSNGDFAHIIEMSFYGTPQ
jgi:hypothetical protein